MTKFHHMPLPDHSTLLAGRVPPDDYGFQSPRLQIWYNNTEQAWRDPKPHAHEDSDECFIVLRGSITVDVEGEQFVIRAGEFCCFERGVFHSVVSVETPVESLMIRAPSIDDKVYPMQSE